MKLAVSELAAACLCTKVWYEVTHAATSLCDCSSNHVFHSCVFLTLDEAARTVRDLDVNMTALSQGPE